MRVLAALLIVGLAMSGCKARSSSQAEVNRGSKPAEIPAVSEPGNGAATGQRSSQQALLGVYTISEVDHQIDKKDAVDMIPSTSEIQFTFGSDGSFMRVARKKGLVALTETGNFRIDLPDQLVLSPLIVNKKPVTDGRQTSYKFTVSSDGDELRLWGPRGNVAIFHRTEKP
jgi:hypothetical protein